MSKISDAFGALAEALEAAAVATRTIEELHANAGTKSADAAGASVAASGKQSGTAKAAPAKSVAKEPAKAGKAKAPVTTFDDVKAKLTELMNLKGKEIVKSLLSEYGVAKLGELEEDNFAEVHAKAVAAMVEEESSDDADDMFGE